MHNEVIFTICTKNYIGLAQVLGDSIHKNNNNIDFYIFVADESDNALNTTDLADNIYFAKDVLEIDEQEWYQLAFKYDLTEFCTCIKPLCFKYFCKKGAKKIIYFDPDILVFSSVDIVWDKLNTFSFVLTPHITCIESCYTGNLNEQNLLSSGLYNCGFFALKNDTRASVFIDWWIIRLKDRCYRNAAESLFTDQRWVDFIPSLFRKNEYCISFNLGLNLAPWNFHERFVYTKNGVLYVKGRKEETEEYQLVFAHFSGYNYLALLNGTIEQYNIVNMNIPDDILLIFDYYKDCLLNSQLKQYIDYMYTYGYYSNGTAVSIIHRRLYRRLLEDCRMNANPFDSNGELYKRLSSSKILIHNWGNADKLKMNAIPKLNSKIALINRGFKFCFWILGAKRFFWLVRLLRVYSKIENHVYLVDNYYMNDINLR